MADVILETDRLFLRRWQAGDLAALAAILTDPQTMAHWPSVPTDEEAQAWLERALATPSDGAPGRLAVHRKDDGVLIGDAGLVAMEVNGAPEIDLGYIIHGKFWGHGFGLEAARGLLAYGHGDLGLPRIVVNMAEDNGPSVGVARKLDLTLEGRFVHPRNLGKAHFLFVSEPGLGKEKAEP